MDLLKEKIILVKRLHEKIIVEKLIEDLLKYKKAFKTGLLEEKREELRLEFSLSLLPLKWGINKRSVKDIEREEKNLLENI